MKDRIKKWLLTNWVLAFALFTGASYLALWIPLNGEYDIFTYPFNVEVFGSVSDWTMILVTAVTAHYLWKTLVSQREVQKAQKDMLELAYRDRRGRIRPEFVCHPSFAYNPNTPLNANRKMPVFNPVFNFEAVKAKVNLKSATLKFYIGGTLLCSNTKNVDWFEAGAHFHIRFNHIEIPEKYYRIDHTQVTTEIQLCFEDIDSNAYKQDIFYRVKDAYWQAYQRPIDHIS